MPSVGNAPCRRYESLAAVAAAGGIRPRDSLPPAPLVAPATRAPRSPPAAASITICAAADSPTVNCGALATGTWTRARAASLLKGGSAGATGTSARLLPVGYAAGPAPGAAMWLGAFAVPAWRPASWRSASCRPACRRPVSSRPSVLVVTASVGSTGRTASLRAPGRSPARPTSPVDVPALDPGPPAGQPVPDAIIHTPPPSIGDDTLSLILIKINSNKSDSFGRSLKSRQKLCLMGLVRVNISDSPRRRRKYASRIFKSRGSKLAVGSRFATAFK